MNECVVKLLILCCGRAFQSRMVCGETACREVCLCGRCRISGCVSRVYLALDGCMYIPVCRNQCSYLSVFFLHYYSGCGNVRVSRGKM